MCTGTYRTREPVEAAVALWLGQYATQLEEATKAALAEAPKRQPRDPQEAERRHLTEVLDNAHTKLDRLLDADADADADGALDLAKYKIRRADIEHDVERARHRLAELDAAPAQEPAAPVVRDFADMWATLSVEVRRDVAGAPLTSVRVHQDKTVEMVPRWGER